jgi:drug/metabolite transporter (DMT)-like permease
VPLSAFALALAAAFVHAGWNLLLARARDSEAAGAVALAVGVVVLAPVAAVTWRVDAGAWPFIVATGLLELAYFALLARAYRHEEVSVVYPLARGTAPVLVLVVGAAALGHATSPAEAAGVCLVAAGIVLVRGNRTRARTSAIAFGLAIGTTIAAYTLVDSEGIEHANVLAYLLLRGLISAGVYVPAVIALKGPAAVWAEFRAATVVAGVGMVAAYALVLAALQRADAAPVAAVRETSVVIATILAALFLKEHVTRGRLAGAALVAGGVALLGA